MTGATHLQLPFGFAATGRTATVNDDDHVMALIEMVLFTAPGERLNRPDFGCGIKQMVFSPLSDTHAAASQQMIHGALLRWLGDVIHVESVDVTADDATLFVTIAYRIRATGVARRDTFPKPPTP